MEDNPPGRRLLNSLPIFADGYPSGFATGFAIGITLGLAVGTGTGYVYIFAIVSGFIGGHVGGRIGRREATLLKAHLHHSERRSTELRGIKAELKKLNTATSGSVEVEIEELNPIVALDSQSIPSGLSGTVSHSRFSQRNEAGEE